MHYYIYLEYIIKKKSSFFFPIYYNYGKKKKHIHILIYVFVCSTNNSLHPPPTPLVNNINSTIYFNSENEYNGNDEW